MSPVILHDLPQIAPGAHLTGEQQRAAFQQNVAAVHTGGHAGIRAICAQIGRSSGAMTRILTETGGVRMPPCGVPPAPTASALASAGAARDRDPDRGRHREE